ncbi:MAG: GNAT family N-acetyltransferase [Mycobacteriales bacterium]
MPAVELRPVDFDAADPQRLVAAIQADMVTRYGAPDSTFLDVSMFRPPEGLVLVAYRDGVAVAGAGFRRQRAEVAEIKRMYVVPAARGLGLARRLLAAIEESAAAAGYRELWLETGTKQPEAMALYASAGYKPVARFGTYADEPDARHFGKPLAKPLLDRRSP